MDLFVSLAPLIAARRAVEHADRELVQAIMDARGDGMSLRVIAAAAGVSHEKVRQILTRD